MTTRRIRQRQHSAIALLTVAGAFNFADRSALAIASPLIRGDLGLSIGQMGLLLSAFLWAYALCQLPSGVLVDRFGPRRMLGGGILLWSAVQAIAGLVTGLWPFVAARVVLGPAEAPLFPGMVRTVRDWYPPAARGLPTGIAFSSNKLGPALAPLLLTPLMLACGWRGMFVLTGLAGIALGVAWCLAYRDPAQAGLSADEVLYLSAGPASQRADWADWRALLRYRTTWGMAIGLFGEVYMSWVYQTWLPGYLEIDRHMSIPRTGWVAAIPFAFGVIGSVGSGWVTDQLARRGVSPVNACRWPIVVGVLGMAGFTIVAALTPSTLVAIAAISIAMLCIGAAGAMTCTLASVVAPRHCAASLHGIQMCAGLIGGAMAPIVAGYIVEAAGTFAPALLFSAALGLVCALSYVFIVQSEPIDAGAFSRAVAIT